MKNEVWLATQSYLIFISQFIFTEFSLHKSVFNNLSPEKYLL